MNRLSVFFAADFTPPPLHDISTESLLWIIFSMGAAFATFGGMVIRWLVKWIESRIVADEKTSEARIAATVENTAVLREVKDLIHDMRQLMKERDVL